MAARVCVGCTTVYAVGAPRCPHCLPDQVALYERQTTERPRLRVVEAGHQVACHLVAEASE